MKRRQQEYDALRALSIVLLLALHSDVYGLSVFGVVLSPLYELTPPFLLGSFFFLAGYFEQISLQKYRDRPALMVRNKLLRIFPPYWVALVAFVFYMGFSLKRIDALVYAMNLQFLFSPVFVKQLLTLWYISVVFSYYVIFGVLNRWTRSQRAFLTAVISVFSIAFVLHETTGLLDPRFLQYYFIFLAGMYFAQLDNVREKLLSLRWEFKFIGALLGLYLFNSVLSAGLKVTDLIYLIAMIFFALAWVLLFLSLFSTRVGNWSIWGYVATASYFAYLFHRPMWQFFLTFFQASSMQEVILLRFFPGSIFVLVVCYFLQRTYDLVLTKLKPG